jgi:hypothetical protein
MVPPPRGPYSKLEPPSPSYGHGGRYGGHNRPFTEPSHSTAPAPHVSIQSIDRSQVSPLLIKVYVFEADFIPSRCV